MTVILDLSVIMRMRQEHGHQRVECKQTNGYDAAPGAPIKPTQTAAPNKGMAGGFNNVVKKVLPFKFSDMDEFDDVTATVCSEDDYSDFSDYSSYSDDDESLGSLHDIEEEEEEVIEWELQNEQVEEADEDEADCDTEDFSIATADLPEDQSECDYPDFDSVNRLKEKGNVRRYVRKPVQIVLQHDGQETISLDDDDYYFEEEIEMELKR